MGVQDGIAAEDAKVGGRCVDIAGWCRGQDWRSTGHACSRVMRRKLLLVPDPVRGVTPMECVRRPKVILSACIVEQHPLCHGQSGLCQVSCRVFR